MLTVEQIGDPALSGNVPTQRTQRGVERLFFFTPGAIRSRLSKALKKRSGSRLTPHDSRAGAVTTASSARRRQVT